MPSNVSSQLIVAAFDFDGTLTDRDSLLPFLIEIKGLGTAFYYLILLIPFFIGFGLKILSRQQIKEKILERFIKGMQWSDLQKRGQQYAETTLNRFVKPQALERLRWHQQQGHCCILVSASFDFYLAPWAQQHGFQDVITSHLEITKEGYATGKLLGQNCWGAEKARRLKRLLKAKEPYCLYAYGDSRGDKELLAMADHPFYRYF